MTRRSTSLFRPFAWACCAALIALGAAAPAWGQSQATLTLTDLTLPPGGSGVIEATFSCNPACGAAALTFTYDPAVLQIDRVNLGGAFGEPGDGLMAVLENGIDSAGGRLDLALLAAAPVPQAANDLLFSLDVTAVGAGQTALTATRQEFSDLRGALLTGEVVGGSITVQEGALLPATPGAEPTAAPVGEATPTPEPQVTTGEACVISTVVAGVPIHVGPSRNRAIRTSVPAGEDVPVTGQFTDEAGRVWWRVQPAGVTTELDRYWVLESDVDERGDCASVPQTEGSAVISGGGGSSVSHTFAPGERQFTHSITLPGANAVVTCSGSPVYPEFQVGNQRSNGQTSINTSGGGTQVLTVFSSAVNRQGQSIAIANYSCSVARR